MPRLFFGLEIPDTIKASLLQMKTQVAGARWQRRGQLHLTLAFLGQVEEPQVALACDLARGVTQSPFELNVQGLGCFGSPESPKILWAGVSPEDQLRELQQNLANRLTDNGFTLKNPSFKPHITISRFRHRPVRWRHCLGATGTLHSAPCRSRTSYCSKAHPVQVARCIPCLSGLYCRPIPIDALQLFKIFEPGELVHLLLNPDHPFLHISCGCRYAQHFWIG